MRKLAAVLAVLLLHPSPSAAEKPAPDPGPPQFILTESLWNLGRFGSPLKFLRYLHDEGFTGVNLEIMDDRGGYYFYSPILEESRWTRNPDLLDGLFRALDDPAGPFHGKPVLVSMDFSGFVRGASRRARELSAGRIADFLEELGRNYTFTDLTSEPFSADDHNVLFAGLGPDRKTLNIRALYPDFEEYLYQAAFYDKSFTRAADRFITRDASLYPPGAPSGKARSPAYPTVGFGDFLFAFGRSLDREVWAGSAGGTGLPEGSEHNLLVYRAAQYAPRGYFVLSNKGDFNIGRQTREDILRVQDRSRDHGKKPVANLVMGSGRKEMIPLPVFVEPIFNALLSAGYEVETSFRELREGADLYYIVGGKEWLDDLPFFETVLRLLDHRRSRFYGPVILHPMAEIKSAKFWKDVREHFHIPPTERGWIRNLPATVRERELRVRWKGALPYKGAGMTRLGAVNIRAKGGDALASETVGGETLALILRSGNHYLVNGNFLHLEASYFLSKMMGGAIAWPASAYVTSGRYRTAVLAAEESDVKVKIPVLEPAGSWTWRVYDAGGNLREEKEMEGGPVFEVHLGPHELAVLECSDYAGDAGKSRP